ncbi:MAG: FAD-dependent monooxygenase [Pseudomonadota bacterium]
MEYHQNGFRPGDPAISPAADISDACTDKVDVLIIGCGPAGLTLAAQLSAFADINTRIVDQKPGPLSVGQADGIACRSVEMFAAFGFAHQVVHEAYQVNEVAFWRPNNDGKLARSNRIADVEPDLSEMPHVILNQARVHDFYLDLMANGPRRLVPDYNRQLLSVTRGDGDHPVTARFARLDSGTEEVVHARYLVGCDGARSTVRSSMGLSLKGASARQLWGVMDILAVTDFPDIRLKAAIQSAEAGSLLIIPREGGYMVRFYIELDALRDGERAADRGVTQEMLIDKARAILAPHTLNVREVAWWSAYEIGQRLCDRFDDTDEDPRIFIAGDACHTHSPKAGQGMNVSMADAFNLGWKLASVLRDQSAPSLLSTYGTERHAVARELIDFDRDMARLFSERGKDKAAADRFQAYFARHARFTAGVETSYSASQIVGRGAAQHHATGLQVGKRFHSAPVIRLADAKPMQLGHALKADGLWRIIAFAGRDDAGEPGKPMHAFCAAYDRSGLSDAVALLAVFQAGHRTMDPMRLHPALIPPKGALDLTDFHRVFCVDPAADIYAMRGINRDHGVLLIIRPDQHVAEVLDLSDLNGVSGFFAKVFV